MKVVVLAGGADQIALIKELKKRGCYIILVDYFQNPPAKEYADLHIVASTLDDARVKEIAQEYHADLICTACTDQALLTVAKVSEESNPACYIAYQTALNVTNKTYMKQRMSQCSIPTSRYMTTREVDLTQFADFEFPLVVKPADCNSSKGVIKVHDSAQLQEKLAEAISFSRTQTAIVEEFKEGVEVSADFYIEGSDVKYLSATSSIKIQNRDSFTIKSSVYPVITLEQRAKITSLAQDIADAFELTDCPLLIQMIVNGDEINVIEFSARMGGGSKYHLIEVLSGVDIMSKYVDLVLGHKPDVQPEDQVKYARMNYVYCYPGTLDRVEGFEALSADKIIDESFIYKTQGMTITAAATSGDRAAGYLITADTEEELARKESIVESVLKVFSAEGQDIMIHNLV